jgi:hypothetical protein
MPKDLRKKLFERVKKYRNKDKLDPTKEEDRQNFENLAIQSGVEDKIREAEKFSDDWD